MHVHARTELVERQEEQVRIDPRPEAITAPTLESIWPLAAV